MDAVIGARQAGRIAGLNRPQRELLHSILRTHSQREIDALHERVTEHLTARRDELRGGPRPPAAAPGAAAAGGGPTAAQEAALAAKRRQQYEEMRRTLDSMKKQPPTPTPDTGGQP